jgi:hypothetical protein
MHRALLAAAMAISLSLVGASTSSAAKEVGESCTAVGSEVNRTLLVFNVADPAIQPVVPEEPPQVITSWKVRVGPGIAPLPQRLEVYRVLNEEQDYRKEAESATVTVSEGLNVFPARIPVKSFTGYLGLYGPSGTLFCSPSPQLAGSFEGTAAAGETRRVKTAIGLGVPLTATVEEDRDNDGYGDETQDGCPISAAFQSECPTVKISASAEAKKRSILVRASVSAEATVDVYGQVGWGFKPNPNLKPAGSKPTRLIIALGSAEKHAAAGKPSLLRVPLPKAVLRRLGRLTAKESVTAKLTVIATSLAGQEFSQKLRVKLKGQTGDT